jgi:hypothetical protein
MSPGPAAHPLAGSVWFSALGPVPGQTVKGVIGVSRKDPRPCGQGDRKDNVVGIVPARGVGLVKRLAFFIAIPIISVAALRSTFNVSLSQASSHAPATPIRHVVVLFMENHSFDDLLGRFCVLNHRCDGAITGQIATGETIPLSVEPDIVPATSHSVRAQNLCVNNGLMNGCSLVTGCNKAHGYSCYTAAKPRAIPNITALAKHYALSDRTFELNPSSSWGGHTEMLAATLDGFTGENPGAVHTVGWGCDSGKDAPWRASLSDPVIQVPSCIPDQNGNGPYRDSPVSYVPTILDRLDSASLSWNIYAASASDPRGAGYARSMCPTFYECFSTSQHTHVKEPTEFVGDAGSGALSSFSIVVPTSADSMHPAWSNARGDNWIAQQVSAVENGPDWNSTAVFITWDDCGCFYDHVNPLAYNPNWGVRVPMIIVSPWTKPVFTDSTPATFASILAFTEHDFGLPSLGAADAGAYDYMNAFDFNQPPLPPVRLKTHPISRAERRYIATHHKYFSS